MTTTTNNTKTMELLGREEATQLMKFEAVKARLARKQIDNRISVAKSMKKFNNNSSRKAAKEGRKMARRIIRGGIEDSLLNNFILQSKNVVSNTEIKVITHNIPLYNRGDRKIKTIIEKMILDEQNKKQNSEENKSMNKLAELVEERVAELEKELANNPLLAEAVEETRKYRPGAVQCFKALKFNLNMLHNTEDGDLELIVSEGMLISVSESNITIKLSDGSILSDVFVMKLKHKEDDDLGRELAHKFIKQGVMINGQRYYVFLITPSQKRSGHVYICPASKLVEYRRVISNGVDLENLVMDIDKLENRIALGASNGTILANRDKEGNPIEIFDWPVKYVNDIEESVNITLIQPKENEIENPDGSITYEVDGIVTIAKDKVQAKYNNALLELESNKDLISTKDYNEKSEEITKKYNKEMKLFTKEVTDGYGLIDIRIAAHWAQILGCINTAEYLYFVDNFVSLKQSDIESDARLLAIFNRIPTAYQIRHHFDKGLLVIWDLQAEGIEEPIMMTQGMHKRDEIAESDAAWRVCNYNKKKARFTSLTIQAIQALGLKEELLYSLADETVEFLTQAMRSVEGAIEFLNLKDEDENASDSLQSKLLEALNANPKAFQDEWIQSSLYTLVEKQLHDMARGKFVTTGAYYYMITDPRCLFGRETLNSKENYLNGLTGDITAVRYPCVNMTEPQRLNLVACEELWFLRDLLVFNTHDGRWCGMGGADFDGDIAQVIFDERIIKITNSFSFITDIVTHATNFKELDKDVQIRDYTNNYTNRAKMYLKCYNGSEVGLLTDYSTKYTSKIYHVTDGEGFTTDPQVTIALMWTFVIGKEIDRAKTNEKFIPNEVMTTSIKGYNPDFMKGNSLAKKRLYDTNVNSIISDPEQHITKSNCPMGKVFRYMVDKYKLFTGNREFVKTHIIGVVNADGREFLDMIGKHVPVARSQEVMDTMKTLYANYKVSMSNLYTKYKDEEIDETILKQKQNDYNYAFNYFMDCFEMICDSRNYNKRLAAYLLALIPYNADKDNAGKFIDAEHTIPYRITSKSCVWQVAYKYLLDLLRTSNTGKIYVSIPDAIEGTEVVVTDGILSINTVEYKFNRLVNGHYTVVNNSNGSFITASKDELINTIKTEQEIIDENNENLLATTTLEQFKKDAKDRIRRELQQEFVLCATDKFFLETPKNVIYNMQGREFTVSTHVIDGKTYPCMKVTVDGKSAIVAGLVKCYSYLVGQKFYVEKNTFDLCDFNATKGSRMYDKENYVRENVLFMATRVGIDADEIIEDLVAYEDSYIVTNADRVVKEAVVEEEEEYNYNEEDVIYNDDDYEIDDEEAYNMLDDEDCDNYDEEYDIDDME